ncbi:MAG: adenylate/guanylate cyclase domain-containing protein, partial [Fimbriimonadaceae bacterium]|nr:adenylate/guanylate cyclase domain-containing protein [Alphaproteobacteria bacterium]
AMLRELDELNVVRQQECEENGRTYLPLNIGIGANTGESVVGNMGSDIRFDYTALGDPVNLASRLEGQTKGYGVSFIVGNNTAQLVKDEFAILELDDIRVKGKTEPERIFAVLGNKETREIKEFKTLQEVFATFLDQYRAMKWKEARKQLTICRKADTSFNLSGLFDLYADRIKILQKTPPPKNWGGVWTMETK